MSSVVLRGLDSMQAISLQPGIKATHLDMNQRDYMHAVYVLGIHGSHHIVVKSEYGIY